MAPVSFMEDIYESSSGYLSCKECNSIACQHIWFYVTNHQDSYILWAKLEQAVSDSERFIELPVVDLEMFARVQFVKCAIPGAFACLWQGSTLDIDPFICFFNQGESRKTLLIAVDNWMLALRDPDAKCSSSSHAFTSQMRYEQNLKSSKGRRNEAWSLFMHNKCLNCFQMVDEDFNDLIPEISVRTPF